MCMCLALVHLVTICGPDHVGAAQQAVARAELRAAQANPEQTSLTSVLNLNLKIEPTWGCRGGEPIAASLAI